MGFLLNILNICYIVGLWLGLTFSICVTNNFNYLEYLLLIGKYYPTVILINNAWKFWALKGGWRLHN